MAESIKNKSNNPTGRPKGTTNKLRVTDFFNGSERDQLIAAAKEKALVDQDKDMIKFCWEQLFGKATMKIAGDDTGDPLKLIQIIKNGDSDNQPTT